MRTPDRLAWPFIAAAALAAMVIGHALELSLEDLRLFGDARARYDHPVQGLALEAAAIIFGIIAMLVVRRFIAHARRAPERDLVVPALDGIVRLGFGRTAFAVTVLQLVALIGFESLEQRWSGFAGGLPAIVGQGHSTALIVHVIVGLVVALSVYRCARFVCCQTPVIANAFAVFFRRIISHEHRGAASADRLRVRARFARKPPLLALGIANRPPPLTSGITA